MFKKYKRRSAKPKEEKVNIYKLTLPLSRSEVSDHNFVSAIPGRTDVCFHCTDWKDEENKVTRDIFTDYGGSVTYVPVQKFLTVEGNVDQRIPEYKHLALRKYKHLSGEVRREKIGMIEH